VTALCVVALFKSKRVAGGHKSVGTLHVPLIERHTV